MPAFADAEFGVAGGGLVRLDGLSTPVWVVLPSPAPKGAEVGATVVDFLQMRIHPVNGIARSYAKAIDHPGGLVASVKDLNQG
jgi:hypothetical protein